MLDSSALLAYLVGGQSADKVEELLVEALNGKTSVHISAVNWGEVYYSHSRRRDQALADEVRRIIRRFPIEIAGVDAKRAELAAGFKARYKLHYADCFAAALAVEYKAVLVTSDLDFKRAQGYIKIMWLVTGRKR